VTRARHHAGPGVVVLAVTGLTFSVAQGVAAATPAAADRSVDSVRRQAATLRTQLDLLAVQQDLAVERYDQARQAVQEVTTDEVLATNDLIDLQRSSVAAQDQSARRVRAIYQAGGPLGLSVTVLDSASLGDAVVRWHTVESLVRGDSQQVTTGQASVRVQTGRTRRAALDRAEVAARQMAAARAARAVTEALGRQRALVAAADADVLRLVAEQRQAEEAKALAQAADQARALGLGGVTDAQGRGLEGGTSGTQKLPDVPAPNAVAAAALQSAASRLGRPYVWGATGPNSFDCSGLMMWSYAQAGVAIPRTSRAQYAGLPRVPLSELSPGDLVFYASDVRNPATIHHVGMYIGNGLSLYAPRTGSVVKIGPTGYGPIIGAARPTAL
jgi:cell wall-associated NlpC family hydrolase